jgi:hypothetical protein
MVLVFWRLRWGAIVVINNKQHNKNMGLEAAGEASSAIHPVIVFGISPGWKLHLPSNQLETTVPPWRSGQQHRDAGAG